ncbi:MAG: hypothetical protein U1E56_00495 [Bauldia sp.]
MWRYSSGGFQHGKTGSVRAALAGAALAFGGVSAIAATPYDGVWEVSIIVDAGTCDQGYLVPIEVNDGKVKYAGKVNSTASGAVTARGAVNIRFAHESDIVVGTGTLAGKDGGGNWTSDTLKCSGRWIARKV